MLHTIKSFLNFNLKGSSTQLNLNKNSYITFNILKIIKYLTGLFLNPLFKNLEITYNIITKNKYLPTYILPVLFKNIFILSNTQNNQANGLNLLRIHKYRSLHDFWVLLNSETKSQHAYNIKNLSNNKTSNFYFAMREATKSNNNFLQLYYFFDKIVLSRGSYLYWVDNVLYNNQNIIKDQNKFYNVRIFLFLMYFNVFINFDKKISFVRTNLSQFRGVENFFKIINHIQTNSLTKLIVKPKTQLKKEHTQVSTKISNINAYYNFYKDELVSNTSLMLNYVLINNTNFFKKTLHISNNNISEKLKMLTVTWYNKVHNTTLNVSKNIVVMYLRAARHFNKGRYSRNRQLYRTGVYWCIWLNVVIVYALHYYFYRVVFAFGYLWLPLCIMILSIFSSRVYKYRYYNINQLIQEFKEFNNFLFVIFIKFNVSCNNFFINIQSNVRKFYMSFKTVLLIFIENLVFIFKSLFK